MKKICTCLVVFIFATFLNALASENIGRIPAIKKQARTLKAFIPQGWKLIKKATGEIGPNRLTYVACVLELNKKFNRASDYAPPRILFIAVKRAGGGYTLSVQSSKAVLKANEGGVWGDPFENLLISRDTVLIKFYGGSNFRWAYTYRFKFQNNGWYLISAIIENFYTGTGKGTKKDYDLLKGIIIKSDTHLGKTTKQVVIKRRKKRLLHLKDFNASFGENQL